MKPVEKKEEIKPVEKKEKEVEAKTDAEEFKTYKFRKDSFPLKSSFKEWVQDNKFSH